MAGKFFGNFSKDIGIDLGTANTLIYVKGKGIVINEPSVVAINKKTGQVLSVGVEAKEMVGRTPGHIIAVRPLIEGVISDFEVTEQMLKYFINKVYTRSVPFAPRPRVVVGIPSQITEVEKRAVEEAAKSAGAREVYLIEEPMAAAIGARLPVNEATASMVVDIGGGTTDIAVISLGGVVVSQNLKIAGDKINQDIINYTRERYKVLIGEKTAEEIKIAVGSAHIDSSERLEAALRGRDLITGLPREIVISDEDVYYAISHSINTIIETIKATIETSPPELVADLIRNGIVLTGGGALLRNLDKRISEETKIYVRIAEDPLASVAIGTGSVLENIDALKDVLVSID